MSFGDHMDKIMALRLMCQAIRVLPPSVSLPLGDGDSLVARLPGMVTALCDEVTRLRRESECRVEDLTSDIQNAVKYAKECETDYPWTESPTASEVCWALTSAITGVNAANKDLHAVLQLMIDDGLVTIAKLLEYGKRARDARKE